MNYQLQGTHLSVETENPPALFLELWEQVPDNAIGYFEALKKADFCQKINLSKPLNSLREGRFFWHDQETEAELRWKQSRTFKGTMQWQIVVAGNVFNLEDSDMTPANGVERSEETTTALLWKKGDQPGSLHYPNATDNKQMQLLQRIWEKEGAPFYYQWLEIVPANS